MGAGKYPNPYSTVILRGMTAISASDIWAVGSTDFYFGQPSAVNMHWDGQSWANVMPPAGDLVLYDVTAESPGSIWAVGYEQIDDYHTGAAIVHRSAANGHGCRVQTLLARLLTSCIAWPCQVRKRGGL